MSQAYSATQSLMASWPRPAREKDSKACLESRGRPENASDPAKRHVPDSVSRLVE